MLEAARGAHLAHALRHRDGQQSYPRRGWKTVLGDPRANPADRGQDAPQAEAPAPLAQTAQLSRCLSASSRIIQIQSRRARKGTPNSSPPRKSSPRANGPRVRIRFPPAESPRTSVPARRTISACLATGRRPKRLGRRRGNASTKVRRGTARAASYPREPRRWGPPGSETGDRGWGISDRLIDQNSKRRLKAAATCTAPKAPSSASR